MKRVLLTVALAAFAVSAFAQGTVQFINFSTANLVSAKIYGVEPGNPALSKVGNTAAGIPAGTTVYNGALLSGPGYLAQLYSASGANASVDSLVGASVTSPFRTGSAAGIFTLTTVTLPNVARDAAVATLQVRVWDNSSGLYATWAQAEAAWKSGIIAAGMSPLLNLQAIGGDMNASPYMAGLQSFNIYMVPEPSSMALAGLGAAALLIFRRRK